MDEEQRAALGALVGEWSVTAGFPYADMGEVDGPDDVRVGARRAVPARAQHGSTTRRRRTR